VPKLPKSPRFGQRHCTRRAWICRVGKRGHEVGTTATRPDRREPRPRAPDDDGSEGAPINEKILEGFSEAEKKRAAAYLERIIANATRHHGTRKSDDPLVL
jgi:hypothetical protein